MSSFNFDADASSIAAVLESLQSPATMATATRSGTGGIGWLIQVLLEMYQSMDCHQVGQLLVEILN
jgi:hypothetical protein